MRPAIVLAELAAMLARQAIEIIAWILTLLNTDIAQRSPLGGKLPPEGTQRDTMLTALAPSAWGGVSFCLFGGSWR
jgi:hypothetical protein